MLLAVHTRQKGQLDMAHFVRMIQLQGVVGLRLHGLLFGAWRGVWRARAQMSLFCFLFALSALHSAALFLHMTS